MDVSNISPNDTQEEVYKKASNYRSQYQHQLLTNKDLQDQIQTLCKTLKEAQQETMNLRITVSEKQQSLSYMEDILTQNSQESESQRIQDLQAQVKTANDEAYQYAQDLQMSNFQFEKQKQDYLQQIKSMQIEKDRLQTESSQHRLMALARLQIIKEQSQKLEDLKKDIQVLKSKTAQYQGQVKEFGEVRLQSSLKYKQQENQLKESLAALGKVANTRLTRIENIGRQLQGKEENIQDLKKQVAAFKSSTTTKDHQIENLQSQLESERQHVITNQTQIVNKLKQENQQKNLEYLTIQNKLQSMDESKKQVEVELQKQIGALKEELIAKDKKMMEVFSYAKEEMERAQTYKNKCKSKFKDELVRKSFTMEVSSEEKRKLQTQKISDLQIQVQKVQEQVNGKNQKIQQLEFLLLQREQESNKTPRDKDSDMVLFDDQYSKSDQLSQRLPHGTPHKLNESPTSFTRPKLMNPITYQEKIELASQNASPDRLKNKAVVSQKAQIQKDQIINDRKTMCINSNTNQMQPNSQHVKGKNDTQNNKSSKSCQVSGQTPLKAQQQSSQQKDNDQKPQASKMIGSNKNVESQLWDTAQQMFTQVYLQYKQNGDKNVQIKQHNKKIENNQKTSSYTSTSNSSDKENHQQNAQLQYKNFIAEMQKVVKNALGLPMQGDSSIEKQKPVDQSSKTGQNIGTENNDSDGFQKQLQGILGKKANSLQHVKYKIQSKNNDQALRLSLHSTDLSLPNEYSDNEKDSDQDRKIQNDNRISVYNNLLGGRQSFSSPDKTLSSQSEQNLNIGYQSYNKHRQGISTKNIKYKHQHKKKDSKPFKLDKNKFCSETDRKLDTVAPLSKQTREHLQKLEEKCKQIADGGLISSLLPIPKQNRSGKSQSLSGISSLPSTPQSIVNASTQQGGSSANINSYSESRLNGHQNSFGKIDKVQQRKHAGRNKSPLMNANVKNYVDQQYLLTQQQRSSGQAQKVRIQHSNFLGSDEYQSPLFSQPTLNNFRSRSQSDNAGQKQVGIPLTFQTQQNSQGSLLSRQHTIQGPYTKENIRYNNTYNTTNQQVGGYNLQTDYKQDQIRKNLRSQFESRMAQLSPSPVERNYVSPRLYDTKRHHVDLLPSPQNKVFFNKSGNNALNPVGQPYINQFNRKYSFENFLLRPKTNTSNFNNKQKSQTQNSSLNNYGQQYNNTHGVQQRQHQYGNSQGGELYQQTTSTKAVYNDVTFKRGRKSESSLVQESENLKRASQQQAREAIQLAGRALQEERQLKQGQLKIQPESSYSSYLNLNKKYNF